MIELYERFPKWKKFGRLTVENALIYVKRYILSAKNETGEDRYRRIMEESPEILRRAPLKDVATYYWRNAIIFEQDSSELRYLISCQMTSTFLIRPNTFVRIVIKNA